MNQVLTVQHVAPATFTEHILRKEFTVPHGKTAVWQWLNDPATFTDTQFWPYRVEFISADPNVPPGFFVGGLNVHHGPFINFAGMMTEIRDEAYRDLQYFYGSYAFSHRLVRPTRLQFWVEELQGGETKVTLQVDSLVVKWVAPIWEMGQKFFWRSFPRWMARELNKRA